MVSASVGAGAASAGAAAAAAAAEEGAADSMLEQRPKQSQSAKGWPETAANIIRRMDITAGTNRGACMTRNDAERRTTCQLQGLQLY